MSDKSRSLPQNRRYLLYATAFLIPLHAIFSTTDSYGVIPDKGEVYQILGRNDLGVRRRSVYGPVENGAFFSAGDSLHLPGSGRSFAKLRFQKNNRDMGLQVQASTKNKLTTLYYFPCRILQGDTTIIEWSNQNIGKRGCEKGIRVRRGNSKQTQANAYKTNLFTSAISKQLLTAQASRNRWQYCSVLAADGRGWMGTNSSGEACEEPLKQCQASGGQGCEVYTEDNWSTRAQNLIASIECANNQVFTGKGSGSTISDTIAQLGQQSQKAKSCGLHVVDASQDEVIVAPKSGRTLIQTHNTETGIRVDVIEGEATIISYKQPQWITIKAGQRYLYFSNKQEDKIESFDPKIESIEMQVYNAEKNGLKLCDQQQVSGGQQGDSREIQLTANEGKIRIEYEMFSVPDKLQVFYEGQSILDTGYVSGRNKVEIPFKGNSGRVKVDLTGNREDSRTEWNYTLYCPQE